MLTGGAFVLSNPVKSEVLKGSRITYFYIESILGNDVQSYENDDVFAVDVEVLSETKSEGAQKKATTSYTAIIAQAILSSKDKKLPLGYIYDYIAENFPDFLKKCQGWRNCVRHNLSLSECFVKAGRARNGRGNYWGIHPRYIKNFSKGDYRKRRASHRPRNRDLSLGFRHMNPPFRQPGYSYMLSAMDDKRMGFTVNRLLSNDRIDYEQIASKKRFPGDRPLYCSIPSEHLSPTMLPFNPMCSHLECLAIKNRCPISSL